LIKSLLRDFQEKIEPAAHCLVSRQRRAKLDKVAEEIASLHDYRKTFSTRTADIMPRHILQKYIGHANIETTARYDLAASDAHAE